MTNMWMMHTKGKYETHSMLMWNVKILKQDSANLGGKKGTKYKYI